MCAVVRFTVDEVAVLFAEFAGDGTWKDFALEEPEDTNLTNTGRCFTLTYFVNGFSIHLSPSLNSGAPSGIEYQHELDFDSHAVFNALQGDAKSVKAIRVFGMDGHEGLGL